MQRQLDSLGVDYEFFAAVDGEAGEHLRFANYSDEFCLKAWRRPLLAGEVGAFASHYLLWHRCVERDQPMIVMEDDVELSPLLVEAMQLLPAVAGLGYVRLAATSAPPFRVVPRNLPANWTLVRFLAGPAGAQCYALFPHGAAGFLAGSRKWTQQVDSYMDSFWQHGVSCLALKPYVISEPRANESTIGPGASRFAQIKRVWRPKRFLTRKVDAFRRHWTNLEYAAGLRTPEN
jgi:glycosyl transferase family 25